MHMLLSFMFFSLVAVVLLSLIALSVGLLSICVEWTKQKINKRGI